MSHFSDATKESLQRVINSEKFKKSQISKAFAEMLIQKCIQFGLHKEIEIIYFVTMARDKVINLN
jgi:hypothetical protein